MSFDARSLASNLYSGPLDQVVKREVAREYGVNENNLPSKVEYKSLPNVIGRNLIGKIMGAYDSVRRQISIDPHDYSRMNIYEKIKLLAEEYAHAAQHVKGKLRNAYRSFQDYLRNYGNDPNEREAKMVATKIANKVAPKYSGSGSLSCYC